MRTERLAMSSMCVASHGPGGESQSGGLGGSLQIDVARRRQKLRLWPAGEGRLTQWWQLKKPSLACVQQQSTGLIVAEVGID